MTIGTGSTSAAQAGPPIIDVWSRTTPRYRRRAVLMLLLLAALFGALCCFTFWLRTGTPTPWMYPGYGSLLQRSFMPAGPDQVTLSDFLSYPISVRRVAIHGVTMGLLFASLSSIPILVSILYRFPCSILFAAMVVFLAAMPWLGITILLGCLVTSIPPFKLSFRYASALLGLVPIAIYFVMASWEPAGAGLQDVQHRALLYAPWFLALLGSCVICAVALGLARLINYRPGGIPPVLAVLFAMPVIIFHSEVGRDELDYYIIEHEIGPGAEAFRPVNVGVLAEQVAMRRWSRRRDRAYEEFYREALAEAVEDVSVRLETDRLTATRRCDRFLKHFPSSRHVPSVLFLMARAMDQRLQLSRLLRPPYRAEYHAEFPNGRSRSTWETLVEKFPDQEGVAVVALHRLALLELRAGRFDDALDLLRRLQTTLADSGTAAGGSRPGDVESAAAIEPGPGSMFTKAPASRGLGIDTAAIARQARRLAEMIRACRGDSPKPIRNVLHDGGASGDETVHPLQVLTWFDAGDLHYGANLDGLAEAFPESATSGYIRIRQALLVPSVLQRITQLLSLASRLDGRPAGAAALFHLAQAYEDDSIIDEAKATLEELVRKYPESCWSDEAKDRLSSLTMLATGGD